MPAPPALVIGLDGVDSRYIDRFSDALPTIRRLRRDGLAAPLESTHPPWTGSAWPSLYTGVDPSYHGVYDFFSNRDGYPDETDAVTRRDVDAPAIWNYLTELGRRSVVVNVPITHPADAVDGALIPGYLAPEDEMGHPPGIRADLSDALGREYAIYSAHETSGTSAEKIDSYERLIRDRGRAAEYLLERESWDFAFVQLQKTDAVFHNSSSDADFRRIYEAADDVVGRLLDVCDEEPNVVLCSDHGMGPVDGYKVYVNEILRSHGFLETAPDAEKRSLSAVKGGSSTEGGRMETVLGDLGRLARRIGISPAAVYRLAQKVGVDDHLLRTVPTRILQSIEPGVDWRRSAAFARRPSEQGIRINLEGRDPVGVVPPDQYDDVRDRLIDALSSVETPTGEPVFEYVCPREALYSGPNVEHACDILYRTTDMNHVVSTSLFGRELLPVESYDHKDTGVFVAAGPDISDSWAGSALSILDIAPLVFSLLREPVPERMGGTVPEAITGTSVGRRKYADVTVETDDGYSQNQDAVTDRLSDLGYL